MVSQTSAVTDCYTVLLLESSYVLCSCLLNVCLICLCTICSCVGRDVKHCSIQTIGLCDMISPVSYIDLCAEMFIQLPVMTHQVMLCVCCCITITSLPLLLSDMICILPTQQFNKPSTFLNAKTSCFVRRLSSHGPV